LQYELQNCEVLTTGVKNVNKCICSNNHTVDPRALLCGSKIGVQHSTAQHSTAQHSTAQHSTAQLSSAQLAAITMVKVVLMMQHKG